MRKKKKKKRTDLTCGIMGIGKGEDVGNGNFDAFLDFSASLTQYHTQTQGRVGVRKWSWV